MDTSPVRMVLGGPTKTTLATKKKKKEKGSSEPLHEDQPQIVTSSLPSTFKPLGFVEASPEIPRNRIIEKPMHPHSSDLLSPNRSTPDLSPPRRRGEDDSMSRAADLSPPRKTADLSPRRRIEDLSPPRRRAEDLSPPRRRVEGLSPARSTADYSPPRRRMLDLSPPRRRTEDLSPPRRRETDSRLSPSRPQEQDRHLKNVGRVC